MPQSVSSVFVKKSIPFSTAFRRRNSEPPVISIEVLQCKKLLQRKQKAGTVLVNEAEGASAYINTVWL